MKSMRRAKLKGQLRQEEAPGRAQRLAPPGNGGKRLAGKFAQQMLHAAPSNQHLHFARGVYQFQRLRPWAAIAASLAGCSPSRLFACCMRICVRVSSICMCICVRQMGKTQIRSTASKRYIIRGTTRTPSSSRAAALMCCEERSE